MRGSGDDPIVGNTKDEDKLYAERVVIALRRFVDEHGGQLAASKLLNYNQSNIQRVLSGTQTPRWAILVRLALAMGTTTDALLGLERPRDPDEQRAVDRLLAAAEALRRQADAAALKHRDSARQQRRRQKKTPKTDR